jgi:hypothetical protein
VIRLPPEVIEKPSNFPKHDESTASSAREVVALPSGGLRYGC